jgi:hypothetical protein
VVVATPGLTLSEREWLDRLDDLEVRRKVSARHSAADPNWTTPPEWVERIRACLGGKIELDPFSSEIANRSIRAERFFTEADDGFKQEWNAKTVLVNPPGRTIKKSWRKLVTEFQSAGPHLPWYGRIGQAIWVGFSVEQICVLAEPCTSTHHELCPLDFSVVFLRKRISFVKEDGTTGSPSHANFLVGLGVPISTFNAHFSPFGRTVHGAFAVQNSHT